MLAPSLLENQMSGPYDINPKIPQEPDKIWAAVRKQLPRADQGEFLFVHTKWNVMNP